MFGKSVITWTLATLALAQLAVAQPRSRCPVYTSVRAFIKLTADRPRRPAAETPPRRHRQWRDQDRLRGPVREPP